MGKLEGPACTRCGNTVWYTHADGRRSGCVFCQSERAALRQRLVQRSFHQFKGLQEVIREAIPLIDEKKAGHQPRGCVCLICRLKVIVARK